MLEYANWKLFAVAPYREKTYDFIQSFRHELPAGAYRLSSKNP